MIRFTTDVEAVQYTGDNYEEIELFAGDQVMKNTHNNELMIFPNWSKFGNAFPGDWIVMGIGGDFYPCNPTDFETVCPSVKSSENESNG